MRLKSGKLRVEIYPMKGGFGCSVWYPINKKEDIGPCFDFDANDIGDFIELLKKAQEKLNEHHLDR